MCNIGGLFLLCTELQFQCRKWLKVLKIVQAVGELRIQFEIFQNIASDYLCINHETHIYS